MELRSTKPVDLSREANGAMVLAIDLRVETSPTGPITLGVGGDKPTGINLTSLLTGNAQWRTVRLPLRCFSPDLSRVTAIRLESAAALAIDLAQISIQESHPDDHCPV